MLRWFINKCNARKLRNYQQQIEFDIVIELRKLIDAGIGESQALAIVNYIEARLSQQNQNIRRYSKNTNLLILYMACLIIGLGIGYLIGSVIF